MKRLIARLGYGLLFAIPIMLLTFALAQAANGPRLVEDGQPDDCRVCHQAFMESWENSAHARALSDPAFERSWQAQGQPKECLACHVTGYDYQTNTWIADGITCEACHGPISGKHPLEPMPAERSAKLCGDCHMETTFEWQASSHAEKGLDCANCHDPHATGLKAEDPTALCASCHRGRSENFTHTQHSQKGLTCIDCHLTELAQAGEGGHSKRDHTFFVSLSSCTSCHVYQMHDPVDVHLDRPTPEPVDAMASVEAMGVTAEPLPVGPLGFTVLAGLIGVALGIVVAPWVERASRRSPDEEEE